MTQQHQIDFDGKSEAAPAVKSDRVRELRKRLGNRVDMLAWREGANRELRMCSRRALGS